MRAAAPPGHGHGPEGAPSRDQARCAAPSRVTLRSPRFPSLGSSHPPVVSGRSPIVSVYLNGKHADQERTQAKSAAAEPGRPQDQGGPGLRLDRVAGVQIGSGEVQFDCFYGNPVPAFGGDT